MQKKQLNIIVDILYIFYIYLKDYIFNYSILYLTKKFVSLQQNIAK